MPPGSLDRRRSEINDNTNTAMKNNSEKPTPRGGDAKGQKVEKSRWPLYLSLGIIATLLGSYFLWPAFQEFIDEAYRILTSNDQARIADWVAQFGFWGPLLIFGIMLAQMFLFVIPSTLVMIISTLAYGPVWGSVLALTGLLLSSSVAYAIGNYLGPVTVGKLIGEDSMKKVRREVAHYGVWAVIIVRIAPMLSDDATSLVAGMVKMGYWRFIWSSVIGIVPLLLALAYLEGDFERLKTGLLWISIASLVGLAGYIIYDKSKHNGYAH